jgi:hypothetical protein
MYKRIKNAAVCFFGKRIVMKTILSVYLQQCRRKKNTAVRGNNAIESN